MPTVEVSPDELRKLTGHDEKSDEDLKEDLFALGLEFEGRTEDDDFELEFGPDRLDRLSVEGVARSLRYQYGDDRGVYVPKTNDPDWTIVVEDVPAQRPYVTGAIARGVNLDEDVLDSIIQLQEKLHATMGRKRVKGAIGIHDLTMLKGETIVDEGDGPEGQGTPQKSVRYTGIDSDGDTFVPLDADREMTPGEVLTDHQTGETYADIVADYDSMPAIYDEIGLFSFPPVINGARTEVSAESRDLFIEMTGTEQWTVDKMLNIVCYALSARGAQLEDVRVDYPDREIYADETVDRVHPDADLVRPDFSTKTKTVPHGRLESMLGIELEPTEVVDLLERAGLGCEQTETADGEPAYEAEIPPYRVDVLHPLDVIDDVGRAYGFNELEPTYPDVSTVGGRHERSRLEEAVRTQLVGLGLEDMLNFHLISNDANYDRMNLERGMDAFGAAKPAEIKETSRYSEEYEIVRTWQLPSLMRVLENNTHRAYPQNLGEVGFAAHRDDSENTGLAETYRVSAVFAHAESSYDEAKGHLQALCRIFDAELETPATEHPSFLPGRAAAVVIDGETVGVIGEVHPEVLVAHDLEVPVAAFELELDALGN